MIMRTAVAIVFATAFVAGCGGETHQDLRAWMADQGKNSKGRLEPLPQIKPYEPFTYNAYELPDPFKPRKIEPIKGSSKLAGLKPRQTPNIAPTTSESTSKARACKNEIRVEGIVPVPYAIHSPFRYILTPVGVTR